MHRKDNFIKHGNVHLKKSREIPKTRTKTTKKVSMIEVEFNFFSEAVFLYEQITLSKNGKILQEKFLHLLSKKTS